MYNRHIFTCLKHTNYAVTVGVNIVRFLFTFWKHRFSNLNYTKYLLEPNVSKITISD